MTKAHLAGLDTETNLDTLRSLVLFADSIIAGQNDNLKIAAKIIDRYADADVKNVQRISDLEAEVSELNKVTADLSDQIEDAGMVIAELDQTACRYELLKYSLRDLLLIAAATGDESVFENLQIEKMDATIDDLIECGALDEIRESQLRVQQSV